MNLDEPMGTWDTFPDQSDVQHSWTTFVKSHEDTGFFCLLRRFSKSHGSFLTWKDSAKHQTRERTESPRHFSVISYQCWWASAFVKVSNRTYSKRGDRNRLKSMTAMHTRVRTVKAPIYGSSIFGWVAWNETDIDWGWAGWKTTCGSLW